MPLSKRSQGLCELCRVFDGEVALNQIVTIVPLSECFEDVVERAQLGCEGFTCPACTAAPTLVIGWHLAVSSQREDVFDLSSNKVVEVGDDEPALTHVRGFVPEDVQLRLRCKTRIPRIDVFDSHPIAFDFFGERRNLASVMSLYVKKDILHGLAQVQGQRAWWFRGSGSGVQAKTGVTHPKSDRAWCKQSTRVQTFRVDTHTCNSQF